MIIFLACASVFTTANAFPVLRFEESNSTFAFTKGPVASRSCWEGVRRRESERWDWTGKTKTKKSTDDE